MKWFSHITIAASIAATVSPPLVPLVVLGATAPDWMERIYKYATLGHRLRHRGPTHYVAVWLMCLTFGFFIYDYQHLLTAFAFGGLAHVLCDALTVTGVPFSPLSDRRFHLFGGRIRTGDYQEYLLVLAVFVICLGISIVKHRYSTDFAPFFYDWGDFYQRGLIDGHEWKQNRFRYF